MKIAEELMTDRFAQAALSVKLNGRRLQQPQLEECAWYLSLVELYRGRTLTDDHLRQEAVAWAKRRQ